MIQLCRVYNRSEAELTVTVEPWATIFHLPPGTFLRIVGDEKPTDFDVEIVKNGWLSVFLNDCTFDEVETTIEKFS